MLDEYLERERCVGTLIFSKNVALSSLSTFGTGGIADYVVRPCTRESLISLVSFLRSTGTRYDVFGNCSNTLFSDSGYRGAVILTRLLRNVSLTRDKDGATVTALCGVSLPALSERACRESLSGLEFACSIPATVGGALYMNAGAYGGCMADVVLSSQYMNADGMIMTTRDHLFSYRHSCYSGSNDVILECTIRLSNGDRDTIKSKILDNKEKRNASQPVGQKSAGSVFKRTDGIIPAKLIDEAGLKGLSVGGASVSEKHAGFIINKGGASSSDILSLISVVQDRIYSEFGVILTPEIKIVPEH